MPEVEVEDEVSAGRADCKMSARLVPEQFSFAAVSLTCIISSEINIHVLFLFHNNE